MTFTRYLLVYSTCSCETLYVLLVTPGILVITPVHNNILHVLRVYNTRYALYIKILHVISNRKYVTGIETWERLKNYFCSEMERDCNLI
jgi:hypothetical protein